jgi:hypothetical protein
MNGGIGGMVEMAIYVLFKVGGMVGRIVGRMVGRTM